MGMGNVGHFKTVCIVCGKIINQCRCENVEKQEYRATCRECADKEDANGKTE